MRSPGISATVRQFILETIDSVPELEALIMMSEDATRAWTDEEIAARNYIAPATARAVLDKLVRRQLVSVEGSPPRYRFSPASEAQRAIVAEVATAYGVQLIAIATLIHSKASSSIKEFARAFDFKKER